MWEGTEARLSEAQIEDSGRFQGPNGAGQGWMSAWMLDHGLSMAAWCCRVAWILSHSQDWPKRLSRDTGVGIRGCGLMRASRSVAGPAVHVELSGRRSGANFKLPSYAVCVFITQYMRRSSVSFSLKWACSRWPWCVCRTFEVSLKWGNHLGADFFFPWKVFVEAGSTVESRWLWGLVQRQTCCLAPRLCGLGKSFIL